MQHMTINKQLYLDGELVGEYPAPDDPIKERELAVALLREKGLYQKPTLEQAIFRQAVSFSTTSSYLYSRELSGEPSVRKGLSVAPFVVNAAFALELYLKTLGHIYNKPLRGHDLLKLFDGLPPDCHQALRQGFVKSEWQCGITEIGDFRKAIEDMRSAFIEWRYLHEEGRARVIHFRPMIFVMEVLHEACRASGKVHSKSTDGGDPVPR
jgi:hypothetical protein